ncbi:serine/threonine-protein kinase/endoribonuclease IRE1-like [Dendronephthya gigantea]|uniref:serine/threonine-protein kinase/endoribonuclease IRE1-like n=1 Tax=Dendronephthya gigantea TaxID=151771 RepID=UPI001069FC52|nr:serine/threonine-protein kinase/endoribonuclease IRE1-like [Dendronephthya gigantea]
MDETKQQQQVSSSGASINEPNISDEKLEQLPLKELNAFLKEGKFSKEEEKALRQRRADLKRKKSSIETRSITRQAMKLFKDQQASVVSVVASKPKALKPISLVHREKFESLFELWSKSPTSITIINGNGVCFEKEFIIGSGSSGTDVFICLGSDGIERAIKRLKKVAFGTLLENERDILTSPNAIESPRIVNYWFFDDVSNSDFCYLIINLYERNLEQFLKDKNEAGEVIKESQSKKMIFQVLQGLEALHTREPRILHRDLKPTNILVDVNGDLVLSDFGIGRKFPEQGATTYHTDSHEGSMGWMAYESVDWKHLLGKDPPFQPRWKEKSDIQVAGMVAFFILTKGRHRVFGEGLFKQLENLHLGNPVGLTGLLSDQPVVKDLLSQMLVQDLDKRLYVEQAIKHPYFLSCKKNMKFLEAVGNEPEIKKGDVSCHIVKKLSRSNPLLPKDWKAAIHIDNLNAFCAGGKHPSKLIGSDYTHCLRLIRNVLQHWSDRPRPVLKDTGVTTSVGEYFFQLFPTLPLVVHQLIRDDPDWKARPALREFFPVVNRRISPDSDD